MPCKKFLSTFASAFLLPTLFMQRKLEKVKKFFKNFSSLANLLKSKKKECRKTSYTLYGMRIAKGEIFLKKLFVETMP